MSDTRKRRIRIRRLLFAATLCAVGSAFAESGPGRTVVVELFTAQGCSSCPPADRLLSALAEDPAVEIVPLAFHVDSWNTLGWIDPYSSPKWTRRHEFYARLLKARAAYTPQAVIDGSAELVGNDEAAMRAAITRAAALPAARLTLDLEVAGDAVTIAADVEFPPELRDRKLDLIVAVYETGLETQVERGENGGRRLRNDYVVRNLKRAARLDPRAAEPVRIDVVLPLAEQWRRDQLGVAAFVQDPRSLSIHGAAMRELRSP